MSQYHELWPGIDRVHWGYFSSDLSPIAAIESGDIVAVHTLSGEPHDMLPAESNYTILPEHPAVHRNTPRGPGPRLMTGPIAVAGVEPGDSLAIEILDRRLRQDLGLHCHSGKIRHAH